MIEDKDYAIGEAIRKLRVLQGLRQEDIAKELGIKCQQVGRYERGEAPITLERLYKILKVTNTTMAEFEIFKNKITQEEKQNDK